MTTEISTQTQPRGLALHSIDEAMKFGKMLADSEFAPKDFRGKPASCVLAVQHGAEIGFGPMQAIQCIAVINGRPSIWGDAALALVMASPVCEYVRETIEVDAEAMVAVCEAKRRGYPNATVSRFSMADAKLAGLAGKSGPWSQYPKRMLQLRARGFALRDAFPDVLKGLVTAEEAQDYPTAEPAKEPVVVRPKGEPARPLTKSVKEVAPGLIVAHVERFEPPQAGVFDKAGEARLLINKADTIERLDALRRRIEERQADGTFDEATASSLIDLAIGQAERLGIKEEATASN